ncbi:MAG: ankyrin repeat domain-containing protein, partial [Cytophagales bacterium]|nr:ankyrin repeat domain-containing protein [Cytophagales bacterium]
LSLTGNDANTPLLHAVKKPIELIGVSLAIASAILEKSQTTVNQGDAKGKPPLSYAVEKRLTAPEDKKDEAIALVNLLLANGADVNTKDDTGESPKDIVSGKGDPDLEKEIEEHDKAEDPTINEQDPVDGSTRLIRAVKAGELEKVKELLRKGADVNLKDKDGKGPLHWAIQGVLSRRAIIDALLSAESIDVDSPDKEGKTPLHYAAEQGDQVTIEKLLSKGASVNRRDDNGKTALHDAAAEGNKDVVEALLGGGADVNAQDNEDRTPLHEAAAKGNKDGVATLLRKDAAVNAQDKEKKTPLQLATTGEVIALLINFEDENGDTPLLNAIKEGSVARVKDALAKGANVNLVDSDNQTPLHCAAARGHAEIVQMLLAKGAVVDARDSKEQTPLHCAAAGGHAEIVQMLLDKGADHTAEDANGKTPLALTDDRDVIKKLIDLQDSNGKTVLMKAIEEGRREEALALIAKGADVNLVDKGGKTALHRAVEKNDREIVNKILGRKGVDTSARDSEGKTPLLVGIERSVQRGIIDALIDKRNPAGDPPLIDAIKNGSVEEVEALINAGASLSLTGNDANTPLLHAVKKPIEDIAVALAIAKAILEKSQTTVNQGDAKGKTPLSYALEMKRNASTAEEEAQAMELVNLLLANGADVNAKDDQGESPEDIAKGDPDLEEEIKKHDRPEDPTINERDKVDGSTKLINAIKAGQVDEVKKLLEEGADVNLKDREGKAPLHWALEKGNRAIIDALLGEASIDVNNPDGDGKTPLHYAAEQGDQVSIEKLLSKGASVDRRDKNDRTALHEAVEKGDKEVVKALLAAGATVNAKDKNGKTALHEAVAKGDTEVVKALLASGAAVNAKDSEGKMPLQLTNKQEIINALIRTQDSEGKTPLHQAAEEGDKAAVKVLVAAGAAVGAKDNNGETPLHLAVKEGDRDVLGILLKVSNIQAQDNEGQTSLYDAVASYKAGGNTDVIEALLKKGANVNKEANDGKSPFKLAEEKGDNKLVSLLKEYDLSELNTYDSEGNTPLIKAIKEGNTGEAKYLIEKGADVTLADTSNERSPLWWAAYMGNTEIVKLLIAKGVEVDEVDKNNITPLAAACDESTNMHNEDESSKMEQHKGVIKLLVENGATVDAKNSDGLTLLQTIIEIAPSEIALVKLVLDKGAATSPEASLRGNFLMDVLECPKEELSEEDRKELVKLFINKRVDVNGKSKDEVTPLYKACEEGYGEIVDILLSQRGIDINLQSGSRGTALHAAAMNNQVDIVKKLLSKSDIEANVKNSEGETPLHVAAQEGHDGIVKALLSKRGIEANAQNSEGETPLYVGVKGGYINVVVVFKGNGKVDVSKGKSFREGGEEKTETPLEYALNNIATRRGIVALLINERDLADNTPLIDMIKKGKTVVALQIIQEGGDVDLTGHQKRTPLHWAAERGDVAVVKALLEKTRKIHVKDNEGATPLDLAIANNHQAVVDLLLDKQDQDGNTPLNKAIEEGNIDKAKALLEAGANPSLANDSSPRKTPLHNAVEQGDPTLVEELLDQGANVNKKDENGRTPLHDAVLKKDEEVVNALLDGKADVTIKDNDGQSPIDLAEGNIKDLLEAHDNSTNEVDKDGNTQLIKAVKEEDLAKVKELLDKGAKANLDDLEDRKPLHWAAAGGNVAIVEELLNNGAQVNVKDNKTRTPLHNAAAQGNKEVIEALLGKGAKVNAQDENRRTPLHDAAAAGNKDAVEALLGGGADVNAEDKDGNTPLQLATQQAIIDLLVNLKDENGDTPLFKAIKEGRVARVEDALDKGADVNLVDSDNQTPLHCAAAGGYAEIVQMLLAQGAPVDAQDSKKQTPLHCAAAGGYAEIVQMLLDEGADHTAEDDNGKTPLALTDDMDVTEKLIDLQDDEGKTALMRVIEGGRREEAFALIAKGADVTIPDKEGNTPLHSAVEKDDREMVNKILSKSGVNTSARNSKGETPLLVGIKIGVQEEIIEALIDRWDLKGDTPLTDAIENGSVEEVEALINAGASLSLTDNESNTPLLRAVKKDIKDIAVALAMARAILEKNNTTVNQGDAKGKPPLSYAVEKRLTAPEDKKAEAIALVNLLLANGADVNAKDDTGESPKDIVSGKGDPDLEKEIEEHDKAVDPTINEQDPSDGSTGLIRAVKAGAIDEVNRLLAAGADVNLKDKEGKGPLHWAIQGGNQAIIDALLGVESIEVDSPDKKGQTPLHYAAVQGDQASIAKLLSKGAPVNRRDDKGRTALHYAAAEGKKAAVDALLAAADVDVNAQDNEGRTALHNAVAKGNTDVVDTLLAAGVDVNAQNNEGRTALHDAVAKGDTDIVGALLAAGAAVNAKDTQGIMPLQLTNKQEIINALIRTRDSEGKTPLHDAAGKGDKDAAKALVKADADVNAQDDEGETPLHCTVQEGDKDVLDILLGASNIQVDTKDNEGRTPLYDAVEEALEKAGEEREKAIYVIKALLEKGAQVKEKAEDGKSPFELAEEKDDQEIIDLLLAYDLDNTPDQEGNTPLIKAIKEGNTAEARKLINRGVDVTRADTSDERSPLWWASYMANTEIAALLISKGAEVDRKDKNGVTPLAAVIQKVVDMALKGQRVTKEDLEPYEGEGVIKLLVNGGANVNEKYVPVGYSKGYILLEIMTIVFSEDVALIELLLEKGAKEKISEKNYLSDMIAGYKNTVVLEQLVQLFIKEGADVNMRTTPDGRRGNTPLYNAAKEGYLNIVNMLLDNQAIEVGEAVGSEGTALHIAAMEGHNDVVARLLETDIDVNAKNSGGENTAIYLATRENNLEVIKTLLGDEEVDPGIKCGVGFYAETPLEYALKRIATHKKAVDLLINAKDLAGDTPLISMIKEGWRRTKITLQIIQEGGDVDLTDKGGRTPLHWAAEEGNVEVVKALLEKTVKISVKDGAGDTPLDLAERKDYQDIVELLRGADADGNTPLHHAADKGDKDAAEELIAQGAKVNAKNNNGETALHKAAEKGNQEVVDLLIEKGADVNATDSNGETALQKAAAGGHQEVVDALIAAGADVNAKDNNGETALHKAAEKGNQEEVD